ncbi:MAG: HEAT repeat domain-containing protein [Planctomycetes bacterium]|nr:HEAT repeat domain-containing protein [Planctomycetota bacterium]
MTKHVWILLLLAAALVAVRAAAQTDAPPSAEERIAEFKKFYNRDNVKVRRAAVEDFKGVDTLEAAQLLVACFKDSDHELRETAQDALGMIRDKKAVEWILDRARMASDTELRGRLVLALGEMRHPQILPTLTGVIRHREAFLRRNAVLALGKQGDPRAVGVLIEALDNESEDLVRQALFEALGNLGDPKASPAIEKQLGAGHWSVRVAAIEALGKLRTESAVGALIAQMQKEEGRLLTDIRAALEDLTGEIRFREDRALWKEWWDKYHAQFRVPSRAHLEELKRKQEAAAVAYGAAPQKYHTIETWSQNMVFCIDASGSMGDKIVLAPGAEAEFFKKYKSRIKLDIVKQELIDLVAGLRPFVSFRIITFASRVTPWSDGMWPANPGNKARAIKKLDSLTALGGSTSGGGAKPGRSSASGSLAAGRTNTYGALMTALQIPETGRDPQGRLVRTLADTLFFLSDGMPTIGETTDPAEILRRVTRLNETRKIVIHTIGFDKANRVFMMDLARMNSGRYVLIGGEEER